LEARAQQRIDTRQQKKTQTGNGDMYTRKLGILAVMHIRGLWSRVWNKIMPNQALFNTHLGTIKNNTQFGMPSKLTPK